jgi:hypothetical protein
VLGKIDTELGNTAFKDDLKEILSTYFTTAHKEASEIRSVEQQKADTEGRIMAR